MLLGLLRRKRKLVCWLVVFLLHFIAYRLLFGRKTSSESAEIPQVISQKGNDHYFKGNNLFSLPVSRSTKPKKLLWKKLKETARKSAQDFGKLNVHIWGEICGESLGSLKNHVLFPQFPSRRFYTRTTVFSHGEGNRHFGERIFGFLHPKKTGLYKFLVRGKAVEVWISKNASPHLSKLVVKTQHYSERNFALEMVAGERYYIEMLHKQGDFSQWFELQWKSPESSEYVELTGSDIAVMLHDDYLRNGEIDSDEPVTEIPAIHKKDLFPLIDDSEHGRYTLHQLPLLEDAIFQNILPLCDYKPSYLVDHVVTNYRGVWETHYNSLYPVDHTNVTRDGWVCLGNDVLKKKRALHVVQQFMDALNKRSSRKFRLTKIISVEENHDEVKGDRYLLELKVQDVATEKMYRLSHFVYQEKGSMSLCLPQGYQWKKTATVNIVLTVGGHQGRWVQHFINNLADIYHETKDRNLNVVIIDFHSKDIDIQASLEKSGLPRYILLHMKSKFHKTIGLQYAMEVVTDPSDIVFVCDLHLYLPVTIVDHIRKHCIQGKTLFNPLLIRLDCGFTANNPHGRWEHDGFGPIATFKSDWDRFGGMNVERFKHSWGGEDWEMVDRILTAGYEIERLKILNFFHFYHTKKGMWRESEQ